VLMCSVQLRMLKIWFDLIETTQYRVLLDFQVCEN